MAIRRVYGVDQNLTYIQDNIDFLFKTIQSNPVYTGVLSPVFTLTTGVDNLVSHGLTIIPTNFIVCYLSENSTIWTTRSADIGNVNANNRLINLRCSASCRASFIFM